MVNINLISYLRHIIDETINKERCLDEIDKLRSPKDIEEYNTNNGRYVDLIHKQLGEYIYLDDLLVNEGFNDVMVRFPTRILNGEDKTVRNFLKIIYECHHKKPTQIRDISLTDEDDLVIDICGVRHQYP